MHKSFTLLDTAVLAAYFVGITVFGLWVARRIKNADGYFRGERKFGWWVMVGQAFGTGTSAENSVAQAGSTFQYGFASIWFQWKNMLITPFYWFIAPWYRRSEKTTIGEMIEERYGRFLAALYAIFAISFFIFNQGAMLQSAAKIISVATGGMVSSNLVVIAMTAAFILYGVFGGLISSAYTDFIQSMLIIVLSFMLIPLGLAAVGGFAGLRHALPASSFQLYSKASGLDAFTIAMLTVNGVVGITAMPHMLSMCATGSTERAGRIGQTYGSLVKRLCTVGWALTGLIVATMVIQRGETLSDPEMAFGYACRELLAPGLMGLMAACILAANMSTCSNFMINTGALFTHNFYKLYVRPGADDRHLLWVGRISSLGLTLLGVLFAFTIKNILHAFLFTETIAAFMGIVFLGGVLWKRANRWGALAALFVSFGLYYYLNFRAAGELILVYRWTPEPFAWAMLAGFGALILVSLLTRPEDPVRLEKYFDNMRRLSEITGPDGRKPLAAPYGKDLLFLNMGEWLKPERWQGFFRRYREDLVGFFLAWGAVGLNLLVAWGIMQIGR